MDASASPASISAASLRRSLASSRPPLIIDVRRAERFLEAPDLIHGALRRDPARAAEWAKSLPAEADVVVYCVHGHEVSQNAAAFLRQSGFVTHTLDGGIEGWRSHGGATAPLAPPSRWVTRERPKIDRIACPWLIRRFIDPSALFFYVPNHAVRAFAAANGATAYDIPDVAYTHVGDDCSFDAFIRIHKLSHPALDALAAIVRGADTSALHLAAQAPGLLAASLGLSAMFADDHAMLKWGMLVYDSLYAWCREAQAEMHGWYPEKLRAQETA